MTITQSDTGRDLESQRPPVNRTGTFRDRDTLREPRKIAPQTPNPEIRTVRRNWTSSSPSASPMMSRSEGQGLRSGNRGRGLRAGLEGWGRAGVGDLGTPEAPARWMELRGGHACWTEMGGRPRPREPLDQDSRPRPFAEAPPTYRKSWLEVCLAAGGRGGEGMSRRYLRSLPLPR